MDKQILAIITARGGSKRIPRKNIKEFFNRPIIEYSIKAAESSGLFNEIMVSTDDTEIAQLSRACGASVPFMRSEETSGDFATTAEVLTEVLEEYRIRGHCYTEFCCIYPTAPFVTATKLRNAYRMFGPEVNTVFTATEFSFPPQRGLIRNGEFAEYWFPEFQPKRSQDLEKIFHDAGQFYFGRTESLIRQGKLIGERSVPFVVPRTEVQDIDDETDWKLAEIKYGLMLEKANVRSNELVNGEYDAH